MIELSSKQEPLADNPQNEADITLVNLPLDWSGTWKLSKQRKALRLLADKNKNIWALPVILANVAGSSVTLATGIQVQELDQTSQPKQDWISQHGVGPVNAAFSVSLDLRDLKVCVGYIAIATGQFTLDVYISSDGINYIDVDAKGLSLTQSAVYVPNSTGSTGMPVFPFRYMRLDFGAAGAGKTITYDIGGK